MSSQPKSLSDAASEIRSGTTRLAQRLRVERAGNALSSSKVIVLAHLYRRGPSTPGEIAAAEHQHPQSLTRTFAELQLAGLISRSPSQRDGRASVLRLTSKGQDALTADMADRDAWLADALADLTDTEVDLLRIAAKLMHRLVDCPTDGVLSRTAGSERNA